MPAKQAIPLCRDGVCSEVAQPPKVKAKPKEKILRKRSQAVVITGTEETPPADDLLRPESAD